MSPEANNAVPRFDVIERSRSALRYAGSRVHKWGSVALAAGIVSGMLIRMEASTASAVAMAETTTTTTSKVRSQAEHPKGWVKKEIRTLGPGRLSFAHDRTHAFDAVHRTALVKAVEGSHLRLARHPELLEATLVKQAAKNDFHVENVGPVIDFDVMTYGNGTDPTGSWENTRLNMRGTAHDSEAIVTHPAEVTTITYTENGLKVTDVIYRFYQCNNLAVKEYAEKIVITRLPQVAVSPKPTEAPTAPPTPVATATPKLCKADSVQMNAVVTDTQEFHDWGNIHHRVRLKEITIAKSWMKNHTRGDLRAFAANKKFFSDSRTLHKPVLIDEVSFDENCMRHDDVFCIEEDGSESAAYIRTKDGTRVYLDLDKTDDLEWDEATRSIKQTGIFLPSVRHLRRMNMQPATELDTLPPSAPASR